jgi:ketopantoate reductase
MEIEETKRNKTETFDYIIITVKNLQFTILIQPYKTNIVHNFSENFNENGSKSYEKNRFQFQVERNDEIKFSF